MFAVVKLKLYSIAVVNIDVLNV